MASGDILTSSGGVSIRTSGDGFFEAAVGTTAAGAVAVETGKGFVLTGDVITDDGEIRFASEGDMLPDGIVQSDTGAVLVQAGGAITLADLLATAGEIAVSACDSIWRKPLAEKLALVGRHILLEAENRQIGTTADLIGARASGVLNASAWGDIWLWIDGDLTSDYLLSMAGGIDVATDGRMRVAKLSAPNGPVAFYSSGDLELHDLVVGSLKAWLPTAGSSPTIASAVVKNALDVRPPR